MAEQDAARARLDLAKRALVSTGYFSADQVSDDIAPRIVEMHSALSSTGITIEVALANAARLLRNAEVETNHTTMERLEKLADSWTAIAGLLVQRERV